MKIRSAVPSQPVFTITYWGVTGSFPDPLRPAEVTERLLLAVERLLRHRRLAGLKPGPGLRRAVLERLLEYVPFHLRSSYGGNTTCVEVSTPDALLILDGGTGLRVLGLDLERRWDAPGYRGSRSAHVLLTHGHLDHLLGLPFFAPFFDSRNEFMLWGTQRVLDVLASVLQAHFPAMSTRLAAIRARNAITAGQELVIGSTRIRTQALNHPGGCLAYRLENAGRSYVFATDHEQPEAPDRNLAAFAQGADLVYLDGQFLDREYEGDRNARGEAALPRRGWGHSTVRACVETALAAGARGVHVGHRDPPRRDAELAVLERTYQRYLRGALRRAGRKADTCRLAFPYEGMTVWL